eukprot:Sdes_comp18662_c0_seq1m8896
MAVIPLESKKPAVQKKPQTLATSSEGKKPKEKDHCNPQVLVIPTQKLSLQTSKPSDRLNPKTIDPFSSKKAETSPFRIAHRNGELPYRLEHGSVKHKLVWKIPPEQLHYDPILVLTAEGLKEKEHPYAFLARHAWTGLMISKGAAAKTYPLLKQIISPLRAALMLRDPACFQAALLSLAELAMLLGPSLNDHYKHLLAPVATMMNQRSSRAPIIDALQTMEEYGGPDALRAIKLKIPTYTSIHT